MASGVYLGDRWVLTAKHVCAGDVVFNGITYSYEEGSAQCIENPSGYSRLNSTYTDLKVFRITEEPDLPSLEIAVNSPSVGTELRLAGNGTHHEETLSYWTVDTYDWSWTESDTSTQYWGFQAVGPNALQWGTNQVIGSYRGPTPSTHYVSLCGTDMIALKTRFDAQTTYEAQAVAGDSGGGAFYWDEETESWFLGGIISCIELLPNAPTQAMAGATTCMVDLSFYRDAILEIIAPEDVPTIIQGDINGDQVVDSSDATIFAQYWQSLSSNGSAEGDFNGDGIVDVRDATILAGNWQCSPATPEEPEFPLEVYPLIVDSNVSAPAVPEPTTGLLLISLLIGAAGWKVLRKFRK
ncbi:MAG: dockerin type I domain-containing protein [Planctomycetia bacterium]